MSSSDIVKIYQQSKLDVEKNYEYFILALSILCLLTVGILNLYMYFQYKAISNKDTNLLLVVIASVCLGLAFLEFVLVLIYANIKTKSIHRIYIVFAIINMFVLFFLVGVGNIVIYNVSANLSTKYASLNSAASSVGFLTGIIILGSLLFTLIPTLEIGEKIQEQLLGSISTPSSKSTDASSKVSFNTSSTNSSTSGKSYIPRNSDQDFQTSLNPFLSNSSYK